MCNKKKDRLLEICLAEYHEQRKIIAEAENARRKSFGFWVTIVVAISGYLASKILDSNDFYSFDCKNFSISIYDKTVIFIGCFSIMIITALFILRGVNCDFFIAKSARYIDRVIKRNIIKGNIIPNEFSKKILCWEGTLAGKRFFDGYYYLNETFLLFLIEIISASVCIRYIRREILHCQLWAIALGVFIIIIVVVTAICIYISFKKCRNTTNCNNESEHGECCGKMFMILPGALLAIAIAAGFYINKL